MGGDSAIHIKDENFGATDSYATAKLIASKIKAMGDVDLVLAGKKWIDEESGQVAIQVAAELDIPQATIATKVDVDDAAKTVKVQSEIEGGQRIIELNFPALVTAERGLNEPRYASLPNIMKAKKKPIEQLVAKDLGVDISNRIQQLKVEEPPKRKGGVKVANVAELVSKLKNEAKVI